MLQDSYLKWMKEFRPERLEDLLQTGELDQHLAEKMAQANSYADLLEKRGFNPWQNQELVQESLMPSDQPPTKARLSPEGKKLLAQWYKTH